MKTITKPLLLSAAVVLAMTNFLMMVSCNNDPGMHLSRFIYPNANSHPYYYGYMPVYADQPSDSLFFATTERWKLRTDYVGGTGGWMTIASDIVEPSFKMEADAVYYMSGPVFFQPNTTGNKRRVLITLDAGDYDCSGGFIQLPYLCVTRPFRYVITTGSMSSLESRDSLSSLVALASTPGDSIVFKVHSDWELTGRNGAWVHPAVTKGTAGEQSVRVEYDPNLSTSERRDTLFLKTKGQNNTTGEVIVDTIPFIQRGVGSN